MNQKTDIILILILVVLVVGFGVIYRDMPRGESDPLGFGIVAYWKNIDQATTSVSHNVSSSSTVVTSDNEIVAANPARRYFWASNEGGTDWIELFLVGDNDPATTTMQWGRGIRLATNTSEGSRVEYEIKIAENPYVGRILGLASSSTSTLRYIHK